MKKSIGLVMSVVTLALQIPAAGQALEQGPGQPVQAMVRRLELGRPVRCGGLTIVPVYLDRVVDRARYATLEDALKNGWITITEVEGGRVPQVKITNLSQRPVFLMGGEILTGCRQDRILAGDVLLAPGRKDLLIPVFCVEQGRWTHSSRSFFSKQNLGTPALRARAQERAPSAQAEIWDRIAKENAALGVTSSTGAYQEAFEKEENRDRISKIEEKLNGLPRLQADTVGVVIGLGTEVVGADVFASPDLFLRLWPKILRSAALSSLADAGNGRLDREAAAGFLRSFLDREYRSRAGLDLGLEYSSIDAAANIQALAYEGRLIHLAGFPLGAKEEDRVKVVGEGRSDGRPGRLLH